MQNCYVGDVGDFGKYGLLREIFGRPEVPGSGCGLRLGVAWYLYPGESHTSDGKFTDYLSGRLANHRRLRTCDEHLFNELKRLVDEGNRNVSSVRNNILPTSTQYHEEPISDGTRRKWFEGVLQCTNDADVVFIDPDNGISTIETTNSPKHVAMSELQAFFRRKQSLIIYHHLGRKCTANEQINYFSGRLMWELDLSFPPWALWYHRGTARVYFVIPDPDHRAILEEKLTGFRAKPCWFKRQLGFNHPHFEEVALTETQN